MCQCALVGSVLVEMYELIVAVLFADVLFGDHHFTGKLTNTWPASAEQIPINVGPVYADEQNGIGGAPLFPYGYGLTY